MVAVHYSSSRILSRFSLGSTLLPQNRQLFLKSKGARVFAKSKIMPNLLKLTSSMHVCTYIYVYIIFLQIASHFTIKGGMGLLCFMELSINVLKMHEFCCPSEGIKKYLHRVMEQASSRTWSKLNQLIVSKFIHWQSHITWLVNVFLTLRY